LHSFVPNLGEKIGYGYLPKLVQAAHWCEAAFVLKLLPLRTTALFESTLTQETSFRNGMPPRPLIKAIASPGDERPEGSTARCYSQLDISALRALCVRSLTSLYQEKEKLFSRRMTLTEGGFQREEPSRERTIIALLGLQHLAESSGVHPFDTAAIRDSILVDTSWVSSLGELGLLTWFTAECVPEKLEKLFKEFDFEKALETYADGRQACTQGLAWLLSGIAHARLAGPTALPDLTDVVVDIYHLLEDNQSECGIFGHAGRRRLPERAFYNRFGTFADQIHAIYALATFARSFQIEEPLVSALACANSICALQGEMGQWWFLYDKRTCRVINRYPVLSLHQDGTAPLGLKDDLRNLDQGLIWDSIGSRRRVTEYSQTAYSLLKISRALRAESLEIRYEVRPDHFGWLLYTLGRFCAPNTVRVAQATAGY
jgi:hypothetical protein